MFREHVTPELLEQPFNSLTGASLGRQRLHPHACDGSMDRSVNFLVAIGVHPDEARTRIRNVTKVAGFAVTGAECDCDVMFALHQWRLQPVVAQPVVAPKETVQ